MMCPVTPEVGGVTLDNANRGDDCGEGPLLQAAQVLLAIIGVALGAKWVHNMRDSWDLCTAHTYLTLHIWLANTT